MAVPRCITNRWDHSTRALSLLVFRCFLSVSFQNKQTKPLPKTGSHVYLNIPVNKVLSKQWNTLLSASEMSLWFNFIYQFYLYYPLSNNLSPQALITLPKYSQSVFCAMLICRKKSLWLTKFGPYCIQYSVVVVVVVVLNCRTFCILRTLGLSKKELTAFTVVGICPTDFIMTHF